jgi:3-(methylthio)propionyl---CoA ligase
MHALMQDRPLLISAILEHAARHHGATEIVSRTIEGPVHRYSYRDAQRRAQQLANALGALGVRPGERVATLAWNGYRHFELYFAVSGMGAVLHTINPRLFPDQIRWIAEHAEDRVLCFDLSFLPLIEQLAPLLSSVRQFVLMSDAQHMPAASAIRDLICFEDLIDAASPDFSWPQLDERSAAALCYTSGTTGDPKGVLYSQRSTVLHALGIVLPDSMGISARDSLLPVVPMFHANAWGLVYAAPLVGAKLVLPGKDLDGASLHRLIEAEGVTVSAGVPTVWLGLLNHVSSHGLRFTHMRRTVVGGAACPPAMLREFRDVHQCEVLHAWGMTEISPLGTACSLKFKHLEMDPAAVEMVKLSQGRVPFGVDLKIVDDEGVELPWDGVRYGHLMVRGLWALQRYFRAESDAVDADGWFDTGDVATLDADGYLRITDRSKDVIKSGGEWISSIEIENLAMAHPRVAEAACIGWPHPKWDERPLLVVVARDEQLDPSELLAFIGGHVAKWWVPDAVLVRAELPHTATGKLQKTRLREQLAGYSWPQN